MSRNKLKSIILLGVTSGIYAIVVFNRLYTVSSYAVLLFLMVCTVYLSNKKELLSANVLFVAYFCYTVCIGPLVLLSSGVQLNYNYFTVILGGFLAFCWGNVLASNDTKIDPLKDTARHRFNVPRVHILRLMYIVSLAATAYYWIENGALLLSDLNGNRIEALSGSGMVVFASQLPILVVPMMYDLYFYQKTNEVKTVSKLEVILLAAVSTVTLMISGFRAPVLTMYICIAISYIQKNRIKSKWIIVFGVVFVFLTEVMGSARLILSGANANTFSTNSLSISLVVGSINLGYIFRAFPSAIPFQHGYTYLINFEMLLPGPDLDFTLWLKQQLNLDFSGGGVTPTILGELYINFGYAGIYIGMFILGIAGVCIYKYFKRNSGTFLGVFYVWQFAHCATGGIANVLISVILYTILYWSIMMFPIQIDTQRRLQR